MKTEITFTATVYQDPNGVISIYSPSMKYESTTTNVGKTLILLVIEWLDMMEAEHEFLDNQAIPQDPDIFAYGGLINNRKNRIRRLK